MSIYDSISPWYDDLFPVGREQAAFFQRLLRDNASKSVLDAGCGTGRHLELFAGWGLRIAGLEPEVEMAAKAAERIAAAGAELELAVCGLEEALDHLSGPYGLAVCLGNTLAHFVAPERLAAGLNVLARLLTPWGLLVTQTVNFDRALRDGDWPFPERRIEDPRRGTLTFRRRYLFDEAPEHLTFRIELEGAGLHLGEDIMLKPYTRAEQIDALEANGFRVEQICGDWDGREHGENDPAIIIVARRSR